MPEEAEAEEAEVAAEAEVEVEVAEVEAEAEAEAEAEVEVEVEAAAAAEVEVEVEVEVEAAGVEAEAEAAEVAFRATGQGMHPATRSSIQRPPRIGSSRLQAPSLLWPESSSTRTAAQPVGASVKTLRPGRRRPARPPAAPPEHGIGSTAPAPRARGSRTPQRR